ncbi:MAG: hypothetical protein ACI9R3_002463 [Verrucomicrobiales bacterium]|jgi:hypothetical protein
MKIPPYTVHMNIITYRKAALLRRHRAMRHRATTMGAATLDREISRNTDVAEATETTEAAGSDEFIPSGMRRIYKETVIIDDDQILIGVPTLDSELVMPSQPAG